MPALEYSWNGTTWVADGDFPDVTPNDPFVLGTTEPTPTNSGLAVPTSTVVTAADTTITPADGLVKDVLFQGNVSFQGVDCEMENCEVEGKLTTTANHIARANHSSQFGAHLTRCLLRNQFFPSTDGADGAHGGIMGKEFTLERCHVLNATDGVGVVGNNVTLEGCLIERLWFFSPNRDHASDGNHCDCVQGHQSLTDLRIYGCKLDGLVDDTLPNSQAGIPPDFGPGGVLEGGNSWYYDFPDWQGYDYPPWATSAILLGRSGTGGGLVRVTIELNWINGGGYAAININNGYTASNSSALVVKGNRVGRTLRDGSFIICSSALAFADLTGNVWADTGDPLTGTALRRNG